MGNHRSAGRIDVSPNGKRRVEGVDFTSETHGTRLRDTRAAKKSDEDDSDCPLLGALTRLGK